MKASKLCSFLVCLGLILPGSLALNGCSQTNKDTTSTGLSHESADLTFIRPNHDPNDPTDPYNMAMVEYKKKYGGKVTTIMADWTSWQSKLTASIAAGDPISVAFGDSSYYPMFAMQGYTEPLNDYIDLKSPEYNLPAMQQYFSYQNKYYLGSAVMASYPCVLWYNKDMIQDYNLEDPMQLYKEGKWDWDTFKTMCMKMSGDTDKDGQQDRWGLTCYYPTIFMGINKTSAVIYKNGKYELNFDDPALTQSLQYIQDAWYGSKWCGLEGNDIWTSWYQGHDCFINEYSWEAIDIYNAKKQGKFTFDYGVCPLPYGPNNKDHYNEVHSDGVGITTGCKNPYHAGKFIDLVAENVNKSVNSDMSKLSKDEVNLYKELVKKPFTDELGDSPVDGAVELTSKATQGVTIATALAELKESFQQKVDKANTPPIKKIIRQFKPISLNFDKDNGGFKIFDTTKKVNLIHVTGADAIQGGSLEIQMNTSDNGEWCDAAATDPTKTPIYGYHQYKISFDYKVKDIPQPGTTEYQIRLHTDDGMDYDPLTFSPKAANTVYHFEGTYPSQGTNSAKISLVFTGHFADTIIIDNLKIVQA